MGDRLLQRIIIGVVYELVLCIIIGHMYCTIISSSKRCLIQITSSIPLDIARNFTYVLDFDTTLCFLLLHVTRFPPNIVQYPVVDL